MAGDHLGGEAGASSQAPLRDSHSDNEGSSSEQFRAESPTNRGARSQARVATAEPCRTLTIPSEQQCTFHVTEENDQTPPDATVMAVDEVPNGVGDTGTQDTESTSPDTTRQQNVNSIKLANELLGDLI